MRFEGATYPPPNFNQLLSTALFWLRMAMLLLLIAGPGVLETLGINNPPWIYTWAQENKVWRKNYMYAAFAVPLMYEMCMCLLYSPFYSDDGLSDHFLCGWPD